jgi:hypothetical protein
MPKTISPRDRLADILDVLDWVAERQVYSLAANDHADIWPERPDLDDVCVTARVLPVAAAGMVRRVRGGLRWEPTDDGRTVRNAALTAASGVS